MKMHKRDYFLAAIEAGCYRHKQWVLEAFSVTRPHEIDTRTYPFALKRRETGSFFFIASDGSEIDVLGHHPDGPLFSIYDEMVLQPDDLPNLHQAVTTTYGQAIANVFLLVYPYGRKVDYINGELKPEIFDRIIERNLVDDSELATAKAGAISVREMQRYCEATTMLCEFTQLCVPAATVKTMTVDPQIAKRRAELIEKYKDRLHDPVVQTMIGDELIKMDREWMKGDLGEGFYFKSKSYDVVRKKLFLWIGAETGFGVTADVIPTSLSEGWDMQYLPGLMNASREGSYNRGALTARGGEATKFNYRIFQNTRITEEDCKSPYGLTVTITDRKKKNYLSNTIFVGQGQVELTEENIDKYVGRVVRMRSPAYCRTEGANFCATCMGKTLSTNPEAISTYAAGIGSTFMNIDMASMHGKTMSVAEFVVEEQIR